MRPPSNTLWLALLFATLPGRAQPPAEPAAAITPRLPEYRIEVIVFANTEFNSAEEAFRAVPPSVPGLDTQPATVQPIDPLLPVLPLLDELLSGDAATETEASALGNPGEPTAAQAYPTGVSPPADAAAPAQPGHAQPFRFRLLGPDELELRSAFATLSRLPAYTPLLHGGWIQEGLPPEQAHRFDLSLLGVTNPRGTLELYLSRFLHVDLDLSYQQAMAPVAAGSGSLAGFSLAPRYTLRTERRLRSGELHFFDHPAFGVLLIVRPLPAADGSARAPAT